MAAGAAGDGVAAVTGTAATDTAAVVGAAAVVGMAVAAVAVAGTGAAAMVAGTAIADRTSQARDGRPGCWPIAGRQHHRGGRTSRSSRVPAYAPGRLDPANAVAAPSRKLHASLPQASKTAPKCGPARHRSGEE